MSDIDLDGHTFFRDRTEDRELTNRLAIQVDLNRAMLLIGAPGEPYTEELVFDDVTVQRAFRTLVEALRRHSYRTRRVTPVPKPSRRQCEVCHGDGSIRNPYSGELFRCPVCG